jgi:hypothetical protein
MVLVEVAMSLRLMTKLEILCVLAFIGPIDRANATWTSFQSVGASRSSSSLEMC